MQREHAVRRYAAARAIRAAPDSSRRSRELLAERLRRAAQSPDTLSRSSRDPSGSATKPCKRQTVSPRCARGRRSGIGNSRRDAAQRRARPRARCESPASSSAATSARVRVSSARHSMPIDSLADRRQRNVAGSRRAVMRDSSPRRTGRRRRARWRPVRRRRGALSRVSTLPRNGSMRGRAARPGTAPGAAGSRCRAARPAAVPRGRGRAGVISASRGSARASNAAIIEARPAARPARPSSSERRDRRAASLERRLELLDEQPLAADRREAPVLDPIALGRHRQSSTASPGCARAQQRRHVLRLPERQLALARRDPQHGAAAARSCAAGFVSRETAPISADRSPRCPRRRSPGRSSAAYCCSVDSTTGNCAPCCAAMSRQMRRSFACSRTLKPAGIAVASP